MVNRMAEIEKSSNCPTCGVEVLSNDGPSCIPVIAQKLYDVIKHLENNDGEFSEECWIAIAEFEELKR